jgi:hypothetical protein
MRKFLVTVATTGLLAAMGPIGASAQTTTSQPSTTATAPKATTSVPAATVAKTKPAAVGHKSGKMRYARHHHRIHHALGYRTVRHAHYRHHRHHGVYAYRALRCR